MTAGARTYTVPRQRRRDTPAGRCAMTTAGQPRRSSGAEGEAAGTRGSQGAGGKPCREPARARRREAMAGRRAVRQQNMAGGVPTLRGAPERRCRSAAGPGRSSEPGGRSGRRERPQPRHRGRPQPIGTAGRRARGGRTRARSTRGGMARHGTARYGTARPGRPERLPTAVRDTRGEDRGRPAAAPLTLR